jgi:hypothetical protein
MATTEVKQHVPVFLSSTYEDLQEYKEEARRILTGLEQTIKGMEFFGASTESPLKVCLENIRE